MKSKKWMILLIGLILLQLINCSKVEWIMVSDEGEHDDAIEIHYYENEA